MKLSELIALVGDDNIMVQNIHESCLNATVVMGGRATRLTIDTNQVTPTDLLFPKNAKKRGIILWMPVDKLPEGMR